MDKKEYIDRAAVKDEILSWAVCINHPELLRKEDTMYCIDNMPTADVMEVRHGRWSPVSFGIGICTTKYRCSICKQYENVDRPYKYCPNCGAQMDAKERDHVRNN